MNWQLQIEFLLEVVLTTSAVDCNNNNDYMLCKTLRAQIDYSVKEANAICGVLGMLLVYLVASVKD